MAFLELNHVAIKGIAACVPKTIECNDDMANAMVLLGNIFYNHLFRAYKEGNTIRIDDKDYIFRKKVFEDHDYLLIEKVE